MKGIITVLLLVLSLLGAISCSSTKNMVMVNGELKPKFLDGKTLCADGKYYTYPYAKIEVWEDSKYDMSWRYNIYILEPITLKRNTTSELKEVIITLLTEYAGLNNRIVVSFTNSKGAELRYPDYPYAQITHSHYGLPEVCFIMNLLYDDNPKELIRWVKKWYNRGPADDNRGFFNKYTSGVCGVNDEPPWVWLDCEDPDRFKKVYPRTEAYHTKMSRMHEKYFRLKMDLHLIETLCEMTRDSEPYLPADPKDYW